MKILYADCFSGVSGDMLLGALIDLGMDKEWLQRELSCLPIGPFELQISKVKKGSISCSQFNINVKEAPKKSRGLKEIIDIINTSHLKDSIKEQGIRLFEILGNTEAKIHGTSVSDIHFHELGAVDTIVDILGVLIAIDHLRIEGFYSSPLPLGTGIIDTQHGKIPIPAPATLALLEGVPVTHTGIEAEMVTPTGALMMKHLSNGFGEPPQMTIEKTGYGAGTRDLPDRPNCLRLIMGESGEGFEKEYIQVMECDIDDMNPEIYPFLMDRLYQEGALDVSFSHLIMKKGRPGTRVTVLGEMGSTERLAKCLLTETSSIGIRLYRARRYKALRETKKIKTRYGHVRFKLAWIGKKLINIAPEYEDYSQISRKYNRPLKYVYMDIMADALKEQGHLVDNINI